MTTDRRVVIYNRMSDLRGLIEASLRDDPTNYDAREDLWQRREALRHQLHDLVRDDLWQRREALRHQLHDLDNS